MFTFTATVWLWEASEAPWHFVTVPADISDRIEVLTADVRRGFGSVKVEVTVEGLTWRTSVFPDKSREAYVLPVKKQVRQHTGAGPGDDLAFELSLLD